MKGFLSLVFLSFLFSGLFCSCREEKKIPTVETGEITILNDTCITCSGTVSDGGSDPVASRGLCWSTNMEPSIYDNVKTTLPGTGDFYCYVTHLSYNTIYYISAFATNDAGTGYGNPLPVVLWMNEPGPDLTDADGNVYSSVRIGNQVWMAENLSTTKYNDGSPITQVSDETVWKDLTTEAYCWYNNDKTTYGDAYGALYNWYAVNTGKLCPTGWHVPSDSEWSLLTDYLESETFAGGKLKEAGTVNWQSPNVSATNISGFTALPGGDRGPDGNFYGIGSGGYWWTTSVGTYDVEINAYYRRLLYDTDDTERLLFRKTMGESVRCVKDLQLIHF